VYPWLITVALVSVFIILKSTVDKMPPVISTVPERYAFGTPLGIVNGIDVVPSAGMLYVLATREWLCCAKAFVVISGMIIVVVINTMRNL
jgi:hypothetical protein